MVQVDATQPIAAAEVDAAGTTLWLKHGADGAHVSSVNLQAPTLAAAPTTQDGWNTMRAGLAGERIDVTDTQGELALVQVCPYCRRPLPTQRQG